MKYTIVKFIKTKELKMKQNKIKHDEQNWIK